MKNENMTAWFEPNETSSASLIPSTHDIFPRHKGRLNAKETKEWLEKDGKLTSDQIKKLYEKPLEGRDFVKLTEERLVVDYAFLRYEAKEVMRKIDMAKKEKRDEQPKFRDNFPVAYSKISWKHEKISKWLKDVCELKQEYLEKLKTK